MHNDPILGIDPDGRKVIFVHGYLGFGSPAGGQPYWQTSINTGFVAGANNFLGDYNNYYVSTDHGLLSTAAGRQENGYDWAKQHFEELTKDVGEDEAFHFVSHSMGAAFAEGASEYLKSRGYSWIKCFILTPSMQAQPNRVPDIP